MNRKTSTLLSLGISIALIAGTIWFLLNHQYGYGNGRWMMPHYMTMGAGGMGFIMIFLWVAVIAAIAMVISGISSGRQSTGGPDNKSQPDALEILKTPYARGEIDKDQYQSMKDELLLVFPP